LNRNSIALLTSESDSGNDPKFYPDGLASLEPNAQSALNNSIDGTYNPKNTLQAGKNAIIEYSPGP